MLTKEYEILKPFALKPWEKFTFKQIELASKKKSTSYVFQTLKKFVKNKILKEEKIGNVLIYSIDFKSGKALTFVGFVLEFIGWSKNHIPYKDIQIMIEKIPFHNNITLITGSYAKGTQTAKSDIDAVVMVEDSCEPKKVYAELKLYCELNIPNIHLYVFRNSEFVEMLKNKEANYGKEIAKNCLILTQGQTYLKLIDRAIENGFNGKNLTQES
jgi:predicted nucleotidyltransferase